MELLERDVGELPGNVFWRRGKVPPRRDVPADDVFPQPALGLVECRRRTGRERRAEVARVDLALVQPVPELVEAGQDAADVVGEEARREANVVVRERDRERVDGIVEPPGLVVHPPRLEHVEREGALAIDGVGAEEARVVDRLPETCDHLHEPVAEAIEDDLDFGGLHAGRVIVEQRVVRIVVRLVTGDVLARQLDQPVELRPEELVVARLPRPEPHLVADRAGARHLGAKVGRDAALLLVVAARDANDARLERLAGMFGLEAAEILEQLADLGRRRELVREPRERALRLGARHRALRRHLRLLVPAEESRRAVDVERDAEAPQKIVELRGRRTDGQEASASGRESHRPS